MSDRQPWVSNYLAAWNEDDESNRQASAYQLFVTEARYVDPLVVADGRDEIVGTMAGAREQFPGWTFRQVGETDAHGEVARFRWTLSPNGTEDEDEAPVIGFDVVTFDPDGRARSVVGFLDKVPAA